MMSMSNVEAVGAYFKTIREHRQFTAMDVVAEILRLVPDFKPPPNPNYISKIENGKIQSPGVRLIAAVTAALGGNPAEVNQLILNQKATAKTGQDLAEKWLALSSDEREQIIKLIGNVGPGAVVAAARALSDRQ
jgi:transcriptional regulator with XRE-family HTH domain